MSWQSKFSLRNMILDSTRIKSSLVSFSKTSHYHVTYDVIISGHTKVLLVRPK